MEEKKEKTTKEKVDQFIDDYGLILPSMVLLTILNTLGISKLKKSIKKHNVILDSHNDILDSHKEAILLSAETIENLHVDIGMIKKMISNND